jgi:hypothetical protein
VTYTTTRCFAYGRKFLPSPYRKANRYRHRIARETREGLDRDKRRTRVVPVNRCARTPSVLRTLDGNRYSVPSPRDANPLARQRATATIGGFAPRIAFAQRFMILHHESPVKIYLSPNDRIDFARFSRVG